MPVWLNQREIEYFLELTIAEDGGLRGPVNDGPLQSTLARPRHLLAYNPGASIHQLAAAYGFGFARNHCFADGNKRVALNAIDVFLICNGVEFAANEAEAVVMIRAVAAGEVDEDTLATWIENNSCAA